MSLKSAEDTGRAGGAHGTSTSPLSPRVWSVRGRLAFLYTLASFGLLALSGFFLYWVLASNLRKEDARSLFEKIQVVRVLLRERPDVLEQEVKLEAGPPSAKHYFRIMDKAGRVLMETPGVNDIGVASESFHPLSV